MECYDLQYLTIQLIRPIMRTRSALNPVKQEQTMWVFIIDKSSTEVILYHFFLFHQKIKLFRKRVCLTKQLFSF